MYAGDEFYPDEITSGPIDDRPIGQTCQRPGCGHLWQDHSDTWGCVASEPAEGCPCDGWMA